MRIAVGQLWQESNTLNPIATTRADFEHLGVSRGRQLVDDMADVNELGGFIGSRRRWRESPEIVGLVRLPAWPSGVVTAATFAWIRSELLAALEAARPVDGVLLALHGSMVAEGCPDAEGAILDLVRGRIGTATPLVATLDLHANVTARMVSAADVLVPYHTMPHVDTRQTGARAAAALRRILVDGARPAVAFRKIPAVVPAEHSSTEAACGVAADLKRRVLAVSDDARVLAAGVLPVQPWLDVPELGASTLVTTDGEAALASSLCDGIADEFWRRRREYLPEMVSIADAVARAREQREGLVVLSDAADATTSGAPGDSVWLLEALLRHRWARPALVTLVAPGVVARCAAAGAGSRLELALGGVRDTRFGTTLSAPVEVARLFDASFRLHGHLGDNMPIDMGAGAVLAAPGNVHVVVTSRTGPHFAPELFRAAGFEPFEAAVVVAKSPCGFRSAYEAHARAIYSVSAPGCAPSDFWRYEFAHRPRPLWPWEELDWQAPGAAAG